MLKKTELKTYTKLSAKQIHLCAKELEKVLEIRPDGLVSYKNGMSDGEIAKVLGLSSPSQVQNVRVSIYGQLKKTGRKKEGGRLAELENRVEHLERWATDRKHSPFVGFQEDSV